LLIGFSILPGLLPRRAAAPVAIGPIIPKDKGISGAPKQDIPKVSSIVSGLEVPWALAFLPDNSLLVTERPGRVRLVNADGTLLADPLLTLQVVQEIEGEGGLHGIAPHPNFARNKFVYVYYTYANIGNQSRNRVARYTLENSKLVNESAIVDNIPGALYHDGGRIKFGPDNFLYITTGDAQEPSLAQNTDSLAGKILKVADTGQPGPGNPFGNEIFSYGHRNPQGIAWNRENQLWQTEHGRTSPTGFDEMNLIERGKNYGWEVIQGDESQSGMEAPKRHSGANGTWAPGGASFVENSLFFTGLRSEALYEAVVSGNSVVELKEHFEGSYGRLRDVITGPDGMLYVTTSNRDGRGIPADGDDKILRINPEKL
jgi:glucose/arabinose dehydrogenase